jgi:L-alanine-DL-glutamate epimerase-like enolase superfamily enzyme
VRQVIGPDVELAADAYIGWDAQYAIRMIRMLEDAGMELSWVEEPVLPDDIRGYAQVREAVNTRISGGEHEFTRYGFRELIARRAVDMVQVDVNRCGGIPRRARSGPLRRRKVCPQTLTRARCTTII